MVIENNPIKTDDLKIVIPCCKTYEFVKLKEIVRCEGLQNYCRVYLSSGEVLTSTKTLGHFKEKLTYQGFASCHRSHLVNINLIRRYFKEGSVELVDNSVVPVSRRMKEKFINSIMDNLIY